ncbi:hypothetical protein [Luteolibacter soli]|uniref:Phage protein n=1 Tax=Luteolibacter soli TaxID=3135280 RepID=A0ABU9ASN6_9BACT
MKHEAEQFDLWKAELFTRPEIRPGDIVRILSHDHRGKRKLFPHRYRVLSPALAWLLTGDDPGTAQDWQLHQWSRSVALLCLDDLIGWDDDPESPFLPGSMVFWRSTDAVTKGY